VGNADTWNCESVWHWLPWLVHRNDETKRNPVKLAKILHKN